MVDDKLKETLVTLADKYEVPSFLEKDPSKFMHGYLKAADQEIAGFLAANMAFGQRSQILSHVESVLDYAGADLIGWVQNEGYRNFFTKGDTSYYRMFTHDDFIRLFDRIKEMVTESGSIGNYIKEKFTGADNGNVYLAPFICSQFSEDCHLIPHSKGTAAKRINMFLRWMVRNDSPVDLGLWSGWYDKKNLLVPLDTHVMQESVKFGLLGKNKNGGVPSASFKTDVELTELMKDVFPGDPCRGDFALFGLGVDVN